MDLFKDLIPNLTKHKTNLFEEGEIRDKDYPAYMVNRAFSMREDTILLANEMNTSSHLHVRAQYEFYLHTVPTKTVYSSWPKADKDSKHQLVMDIYHVNSKRALEILDLLEEEDLKKLEEFYDFGGKRK